MARLLGPTRAELIGQFSAGHQPTRSISTTPAHLTRFGGGPRARTLVDLAAARRQRWESALA
jgi:hypothetical protein